MALCEICGKRFHACGNCGLDDWEWVTCGPKCEEEFKAHHQKETDRFLDSLTIEQKVMLLTMYRDDYPYLLLGYTLDRM